MAPHAGWRQYRQDTAGWAQGPTMFRDTCGAVEIMAGNKPVNFLSLVKQLRGGHAPLYANPEVEKALVRAMGCYCWGRDFQVSRGGHSSPSASNPPLLLFASQDHRQVPAALSRGQGRC